MFIILFSLSLALAWEYHDAGVLPFLLALYAVLRGNLWSQFREAASALVRMRVPVIGALLAFAIYTNDQILEVLAMPYQVWPPRGEAIPLLSLAGYRVRALVLGALLFLVRAACSGQAKHPAPVRGQPSLASGVRDRDRPCRRNCRARWDFPRFFGCHRQGSSVHGSDGGTACRDGYRIRELFVVAILYMHLQPRSCPLRTTCRMPWKRGLTTFRSGLSCCGCFR